MVNENHIASRRKRTTLEVVNDKFLVLKDWIENGIPWRVNDGGTPAYDSKGKRILIEYPTDLTSFVKWSGLPSWTGPVPLHNRPLIEFARSTLNQPSYKSTRVYLRKTLEGLSNKAKLQLEKENKQAIIDLQKAEIAYLNKVRKQQEADVIQLRRSADAANRKLGDEHALRLRNERELRDQVERLEEKIAELLKTLSTVAPLAKRRK